MTPEQEAREEIDDQLHRTGWAVQSASEMDISAACGVAVPEFPLKTGFADHPQSQWERGQTKPERTDAIA